VNFPPAADDQQAADIARRATRAVHRRGFRVDYMPLGVETAVRFVFAALFVGALMFWTGLTADHGWTWVTVVVFAACSALARLGKDLHAQGHVWARYVGIGFGRANGAAIFWYSGWAGLAWQGVIPGPVQVGYWWCGAAAFGVLETLNELAGDLRDGGYAPKFFAVWGPYRVTAVISFIEGALFAFGITMLTQARPDIPGMVGAPSLCGALWAFLTVAQLANKRREYPVLAAIDVAGNGVIAGLIVGAIVLMGWLWLKQQSFGDVFSWQWLALCAALGAAVRLWRRFGRRSKRCPDEAAAKSGTD
jgi:hypothetical protein